MPRFPLMGVTITAIEGRRVGMRFNVTAESAATADALKFELNVTAVLRSAWNARHRLIGAALQIDPGTGSLTTLTKAELGPEISMSGSIDGYGVRSLSFNRFGAEYSPLRSAVLRAQKRVTLTGYLGVPGAVASRPMFDGYTRSGSFEDYPPVASVECQDVSLAWTSAKVYLNIEPASLMTRKELVLQVLDEHAIPYGDLDFGRDDGGTIYKAVAEGGERSVLDWLTDFLSPIARKPFWRDGKLHVRRFNGAGTIQRTLRAADGIKVSIGSPATNDTNSVTVTANLYGYRGQEGRIAKVTVDVTNATYAPATAVTKQDCTTGALSNVSLTSSAVEREVARVETISIYEGGTLVERYVEEKGWYAPRACALHQDTSGNISYNDEFDVYRYADGSWRAIPQEQYLPIRRTHLKRTFDSVTGFLQSEERWEWSWRAHEAPIKTINNVTLAETSIDRLVTEDGRALESSGTANALETGTIRGREIYDVHYVFETVYSADEEGQLSGVGTTAKTFRFPLYIPAQAPAAFTTSGLYAVMGPIDSPRYVMDYDIHLSEQSLTRSADYTCGPTVSTTYTQEGESTYRKRVQIIPGDGFNDPPAGATPSDEVLTGARPYVEQLTVRQEPQFAEATVTDEARIAIGQEVNTTTQNDYCETIGELETVALELLRDASHIPVTITMPIDWTIDEGDVIELDYAPITVEPMRLLVWDCNWTLNLATGANEQTLSCRYYPPAIAAV
jgi:hypothetical protein